MQCHRCRAWTLSLDDVCSGATNPFLFLKPDEDGDARTLCNVMTISIRAFVCNYWTAPVNDMRRCVMVSPLKDDLTVTKSLLRVAAHSLFLHCVIAILKLCRLAAGCLRDWTCDAVHPCPPCQSGSLPTQFLPHAARCLPLPRACPLARRPVYGPPQGAVTVSVIAGGATPSRNSFNAQ